MTAIIKRELRSYFLTPLGYIFLGVFLSIAGIVFQINNVATLSSDMFGFLSMMSYVWMLLCPILVMRLLAGERKQLTDQLLMTAPLSSAEIVLGKYIAACLMLLISTMLSLFYPLLVGINGRIYPMELITGYLGFTLQGFAFIAFDLMLSAVTANPISAAALCFGANLFLWLSGLFSASSTSYVIREVLGFFNLYERFTPFLHAQLSLANMVFFAVFSFVCITACVQLVQARRWSEVT